ncbi:MAG: N-acetyl sugar amidotransferase [Chitinophagaceae bacterium]|nr:N-acetyl sugar amidotransferase [Chitinophagaceae bacterium]
MQICKRCVINSNVPGVKFDADGYCNYCTSFIEINNHIIHKDPALQQRELEAFVAQVKKNGKGKQYDCIVGVSGGVDSSWVLVKVKELGLRPLAVHMDNGWNSELAQNNIENLVRGLGVDLYTHVIDWEEYRELMQAFFDADVIDVELLYDNAMLGVIYTQAAKHGLRYILAGYNKASEGLPLPESWSWNKFDKRNIKALAKMFGNVKIKTFPSLGPNEWAWYHYIKLIQLCPFLDYFPYNKFEALEVLQRDFSYKPYPYKHYESIFTRFYQGYILPRKFGVDKRIIHLATLVAAKQMTREDALKGLEGIPYPSQKEMENDREYFLKKMNWTSEMLDDYLKRPEKKHDIYPSEKKKFEFVSTLPNRIPARLKTRITNFVKSIR